MANNLIQIKRSLTTSTPSSLANGELAYTANGDVLFIGSNSGVVAIGGKRVPGTLTANQAIVVNATSGIDKVIVANLVPTKIYANGAHGSSGQVLAVDAGGNVHWSTPTSGVAGSNTQVQFNDSGSLAGSAGFTFDKTTNNLSIANTVIVGNSTVNAIHSAALIQVANSTGTANLSAVALTIGTSVVNSTVVATGANVFANLTTVFVGNSTVNASHFATGFQVANSTSTTNVTSIGVSVGTNVVVNTSTVFVGNSTVNTTHNSSLIQVSNSTSTANLSAVALTIGTTVVNSSIVSVGAATVNNTLANVAALNVTNQTNTATLYVSTSANVGTAVVANATGVYVVGTVNATTLSTGATFTANSTLVNAAAINVTGAVNTATLYAATSANVGGAVLANTSGLFVSGNTRLGDASSDQIDPQGSFANSIMPFANVTFNIGSNLMRFNEIHASNVHSVAGYFDGSVSIAGNLVVSGNLVTTNVQSVIISDPLIFLAGNNTVSDLVDIGFVGHYFDGSQQRHTGVIRHAATDEYYLFRNYSPEPTTNIINIADPSFVLSTINGYLKSGGLTTNATHVVVTANSTVNVTITANTLTLSTPLAATSGGTGLNSYTSGDILIANTGNVLSKLALGSSGYVLQSNGTAVVYDTLDGGTF